MSQQPPPAASQQFEQNQIESKFRIIKTDSSGNHSSINADQTDNNNQIEDMNGVGMGEQQHQGHQQQTQHASLSMIGNYQKRGRWFVKDFSPDQLINQTKTAPSSHHPTLEEPLNTNHVQITQNCK